MDKKRRFCNHCNEFVTYRTYRAHYSLFYDEKKHKWQKSHINSSGEDTDDDIDQNTVYDHELPVNSLPERIGVEEEYTQGKNYYVFFYFLRVFVVLV